MLGAFTWSVLIAASSGATAPTPSDQLTHAALVSFLDGGVVRVVERTGAGQGTFIDPATDRRAPVRIGDDVIVTVPTGADRAAVFAALSLRETRELSARLGLILVVSDIGPSGAAKEDALALAARLMSAVEAGLLDGAYPNLSFRKQPASITIPPDDPLYGDQFFLEDIDIEDAWAITTGSAEVTVVVADNGCDLAHPDLIDKLDLGFDPFEDDDDPSWKEGVAAEHGTACAGLVAASTDNATGIAGACPECRLRCARLLPAAGESATVAVDVLTFDFAFQVDADVVSNSWGFVDAIPVPTPLRDAIVDVQQHGRGGRGAVVVFAAGNDSRIVYDDELLAVDGVLGVGAVSNVGELTQYSNGGRSVDLVAPTGAVAPDVSGPDGSSPGDFVSNFSGTSSACPIVAGIAGLLIADDPQLTADEINQALVATARQSLLADPDSNGHDPYFGYGLVQPAAALAFYDPPVDPPPPPGCGSCAHAPLAAPLDAGSAAALLALAHGVARRGRARRARPQRSRP